MVGTMFRAFAYDQSRNPMSKGKHKRCSYCFSKGNLEMHSIGVYICGKCKSTIEREEVKDKEIGREIFRYVKREFSFLNLKGLADLFRYLVFEQDEGFVKKIRHELKVRGSIDVFYLDYVRTRLEKIIEIKREIQENVQTPDTLLKFFMMTPTQIFYVIFYFLDLHYFTSDTKQIVKSLLGSFGIQQPEILKFKMKEFASLVSKI